VKKANEGSNRVSRRGGDRSLAGVGVGNDELDTFLKFLSKAYIYSYKFVH
jgi:hypothetical protein